MTKIKFGTDGWRAIIAEDFTVANVARVSEATAKWVLKNGTSKSVVIGHDCRFAGQLFAETCAQVMIHYGINVSIARNFVSTPMISLGAVKLGTDLGIIITASHNPPAYNGFKIKGSYGGPLMPELVQDIEDMIADTCSINLKAKSIDEWVALGKATIVDLESMYVEHVEKNFDLNAIRNANMQFAYDAMYGAGQNVMRRLFPDITF